MKTHRSRVKTEHAVPKNGGGYYGTREEPKAESRAKRRHDDKAEARDGEADTAAESSPAGVSCSTPPIGRARQEAPTPTDLPVHWVCLAFAERRQSHRHDAVAPSHPRPTRLS